MTTNTGSGRSGRTGPLTIASLLLAIVLPPIGLVLGFFAARRESNLGYLAVFLGLVGTVLAYTAGVALLSPVIAPEEAPASNPIIGFTVALVVLAVVGGVRHGSGRRRRLPAAARPLVSPAFGQCCGRDRVQVTQTASNDPGEHPEVERGVELGQQPLADPADQSPVLSPAERATAAFAAHRPGGRQLWSSSRSARS